MDFNDKRVDIKRRVSFDHKICDDLCEFLLQWLPVEDKLNLRSVSTQFERSLINLAKRKKELKVDFEVDLDHLLPSSFSGHQFTLRKQKSAKIWINQLTHILTKFNDIDTISITIFPSIPYPKELLEVIVDKCNRLKSICFDFKDINQITLNKFGLKFGESLQVLTYSGRTLNFDDLNLVTMCPNLISLSRCEVEPNLWLNSGVTTNKLKKLKILIIGYNCNEKTFNTFINKCLQLTHLSITIRSTKVSIEYIIAKLSELKSLEKLTINFHNICSEPLVFGLQMIALKCLKLKSLKIGFFGSTRNNNLSEELFFKLFQHFPSLTQLSLELQPSFGSQIDLKFLEKCRQLTHLKVNSSHISDKTFVDIEKTVPGLKSLRIGTNQKFTDETLKWISKLNGLRELIIRENCGPVYKSISKGITDSGVIALINGCNTLETLKIEYSLNITENVFNAILEKSAQISKRIFEYELWPKRDIDLVQLITKFGQSVPNLKLNEPKNTPDFESPVLECQFY